MSTLERISIRLNRKTNKTNHSFTKIGPAGREWNWNKVSYQLIRYKMFVYCCGVKSTGNYSSLDWHKQIASPSTADWQRCELNVSVFSGPSRGSFLAASSFYASPHRPSTTDTVSCMSELNTIKAIIAQQFSTQCAKNGDAQNPQFIIFSCSCARKPRSTPLATLGMMSRPRTGLSTGRFIKASLTREKEPGRKKWNRF